MKKLSSETLGEGSPPVEAPGLDEAIEAAREDVLERVLTSGAIILVIGVLARLLGADLLGVAGYVLAAAAFFLLRSREEWSFKWRTLVLLGIFYLAALLNLFRSGFASSGSLFLAVTPPLAILLLGSRAGVFTTLLSLFTWLGAGLLFKLTGFAPVPFQPQDLLNWLNVGVDLLLIVVVFSQVLQQFREAQDFVVSVAQQKRDLQETRAELTQRTRQLDYERYLLHTLLDTVSDKIFFKDLSGRFTRISQAVAQQFGVPPQQVIGKTDFDFFSSEYAQAIQAEERAMLESGQPIMDQVERETWRDGRPDTWAVKSRLPLKDVDGKVVGWFGMARDITEIKKAQEADQRHMQQLSTIAEAGRAVTSSLDIRTLLHALVELLQQSFGYYGVNAWLLPEPGDTVELMAGYSPEGEDLRQGDFKLPIQTANNVTLVCKSGAHRLVNDLEHIDQLPLAEKFPQTRSHLVLPLRIAEKTIGALEILERRAQAFAEDDVVLLRSLADQVTVAIRNATLYQSEQSRRNLAETLYRVGRALSSTIDLAEVLDLILEQLDEIVPADRSSVMMLDGDQMRIMASRGFPQMADISEMRVPLRDDIIFGTVFGAQQPLAIPDVLQYQDWQQMEALPLARSWLGVPLIHSDQVIGMLSLVRQTYDPYTISEITLAQTFAGQASLALENARLYDNLARFNQQLEEMVKERTEELLNAYDQLERLDRTKSDFIRVTSHELRTPLTVLSGYSQMLMQAPMIQEQPELHQLVDGIYAGGVRLHEIVNSMLDITKIDSRALELSPQPVILSFLVKNVAGNFEIAMARRKLAFTVEGLRHLPPIEADSDALQKVFYQLISNAIKYTPDGGQITVSGRFLPPDEKVYPDGGVEIVVSDTGIGVDPALHELIFTKFYQTGEVSLHSSGKTKFMGGGPGLGLPIARGIIQAHSGKLWVESSAHDEIQCPGSHFHVVLPARQRIGETGSKTNG